MTLIHPHRLSTSFLLFSLIAASKERAQIDSYWKILQEVFATFLPFLNHTSQPAHYEHFTKCIPSQIFPESSRFSSILTTRFLAVIDDFRSAFSPKNGMEKTAAGRAIPAIIR